MAEEVYVALAVALTVGIPGIMSAIGVGMAGVAAAGVSAEDPKKFSKSFVLEILPGTQGIYGFVAGFLAMIGGGVFGGTVPTLGGLAVMVACVPAMLQGFTAILQGRVATASISAVAKRPETFGHCIMYTVMVELYAILGFLATILLFTSFGVM